MPAIKTARSSPNYPLRAQKTITFTGGAGAGAFNDIVAVFAITGRVLINKMTGFVTTTLVSAGGGTISLGTATNVASIFQATNATLAVNRWWVDPTGAAGIASPLYVHTGGNVASNYEKLTSEAIQINVLTANVTAGVIVFDCWYTPVTSNGFLS